MPDQAQGLRTLADQSRITVNAPSPYIEDENVSSQYAVVEKSYDKISSKITQAVRVIAVTSGKGGVGKTNFSTNLALTLAYRKRRVTVVDADLGLANLHVILGITPHFTLEHVLRGERTLEEALYTGPLGIRILGGASGIADMANLDSSRRDILISALQNLDRSTDILLLDTGAGVSDSVLSFLSAAQEVLVVTTPEPTALTDAYATIKTVVRQNPDAIFRLVVNMSRSQSEGDAVANRLKNIADRFLQKKIEYLGQIPYDVAVPKAVRAQQPFVLSDPRCLAAQAIRSIADTLIAPEELPAQGAGLSDLLSRMHGFFTRRVERGGRG